MIITAIGILVMNKQIKRTNKPSKTRTKLKNNTGRPWPMTPKAGVTLTRRRYQIGGKHD